MDKFAIARNNSSSTSKLRPELLNFDIDTVMNMECNILWLKAPDRAQGTVFSVKVLFGALVGRH